MLERISVTDAVLMVGVPKRTLQALALQGKIPKAAKIGRRWTFDVTALRGWIREREIASCPSAEVRPVPSGVATSYGGASKLRGRTSDGLYAQAIRSLRGNVSKPTANG